MAARHIRLAALAAAVLAGPASAVQLAPNGIGQALVYPYYTVNAGNQTILSVVNTKDEVKAVRVRFVESRNGREVLDFNLYLAPYDVWTAALLAIANDGPANLVTLDRSCTVPAIVTNPNLPQIGTARYVPFRNFAYADTVQDGGGTNLARTREGRFELIEMGVVQSGSAAGQLADEATHAANGVPINCGALVGAWQAGGAWTLDASGTIGAPTGGLFGSAAIIDVENGTMVEYEADAIANFYRTGSATADLHFGPGNARPSLDDARTGGTGTPVTSVVPADNAVGYVTSSWARGVDAVSAVYMAEAILNEYVVDPALDGSTEWVVTFPTKRWYVDSVDFGGVVTLPSAGAGLRNALPPFSGFGFTRNTNSRSGSFACEYVDFTHYDRERATPNNDGIILDPPPAVETGDSLCEETNVVSFGGPSIFGSTRVFETYVPFIYGWTRLSFVQSEETQRTPGFTSADGDRYDGLPVTGFAATNVVNANAAPGKLANYAGAQKHRTVPKVQSNQL